MAKLILVNGPLGSGKSTLAKEYAQLNPMTLVLDIDELWFKISHWRDNWDASSKLAKELAADMVAKYLSSNNDVVVPQIIQNEHLYALLKEACDRSNGVLIEIFLDIPLDSALDGYLERMSKQEYPDGYKPDETKSIEEKVVKFKSTYENMIESLNNRDGVIKFTPKLGNAADDAKKINQLVKSAEVITG